MAFVSSFTPAAPLLSISMTKSPYRRLQPPISSAKPPNPSNPPEPKFEPFDGSKPLLPPWRPPTLESDFHYNAERMIARESTPPPRKIVQVHSPNKGTLFAEVVQHIDLQSKGQEKRFWLRPLLLDGVEGTFMDLRGGSDVLIGGGKVEEVAGEARVRVEVNLAATEADVVGRFVEDDFWGERERVALLDFMQSIAEES